MFEGRMMNTGWGYTGSEKKGFEWLFTPDDKDAAYCADSNTGRCYPFCLCRSGNVFQTEAQAVKAGKRWMKECKRSGIIEAVKATPRRFEY